MRGLRFLFHKMASAICLTSLVILCHSNAAAPGEISWIQGGHSWTITDLKISDDGSKLFSASQDGTIKLWDTSNGRLIRSYLGYTNEISAIAINSDGSLLACGGKGGEVILWAAESGLISRRFKPYAAFGALAFSPDGSSLLTASGTSSDPTMKLWSVGDGSLLKTFVGHTNWPSAVRFKPDGRTLISYGVDSTICTWDLASAQLLATYNAGPSGKADIARDGESVAVARSSIRRFNTADGSALPTFGTGISAGPGAVTMRVAFSLDGVYLAAGAGDLVMRIWRTDTGEQLHNIRVLRPRTEGGLQALVFSPDSKKIFSAGADFQINEWDVESGNLERAYGTLLASRGEALHAQFSPDGMRIVAGGPRLYSFDATDGRLLFSSIAGSITALTCSPDGNYLILGYTGAIEIRNPANGDLVRHYSEIGGIYDLAFSPTISQFASVSWEGLRVWLPQMEFAPLRTYTADAKFRTVVYSKDGTNILTGDDRGMIRWWSWWHPDNKEVRAVKGHESAVSDLQLSPDGKILASSGGADNKLKLWDSSVGTFIREMTSFYAVKQSTFSPDGRLLAAICVNPSLQEGEVRIWRVADGQLAHVLTNEVKRAFSIDWSADGKLVVGRDDAVVTLQAPAFTPELVRLTAVYSTNRFNLFVTGGAGQNVKIERSSDLRIWRPYFMTTTGSGGPPIPAASPSLPLEFFRAVPTP